MKLFKLKKKQSDLPRRRLAEEKRENAPISSEVFRRNRTLTGTTSNHFGSVGIKSDLESPRAHVHDLSSRRRRVFSVLLIVMASAILIWLLVSNFTAIVAVRASDTSISRPIDSSTYESVIQEYLSKNPMSRLRFLLNESALSDYVSSKLPEVIKVKQQNLMGIGKTYFAIKMRTPVAGWNINDKQYYVDSSGMSFEVNYFSEPDVQIVDNSGISLESGTAIASKRFLSFVGRVVSLSNESGYTITRAILPANTTRQLEVGIKEGDFLVKLSIDRPAGEQVEDMSRAIKFFISRGLKPGYIDVRVSGKAFYKL